MSDQGQNGESNSRHQSLLANVRIVLVEPAGPLNVGAIARVIKNFGLQQLVLVNPHCDPHGAEARQMAVHAQDLLNQVQIVPTLSDALSGCQRAIATTARERGFNAPLELPEQAFPWLLAPGVPTALIFGPEDRGLNNDELYKAQRIVKIPTDLAYESMNLAQAVAVSCYELSCIQRGRRLFSEAIPIEPILESTIEPTGILAEPAIDSLPEPFDQAVSPPFGSPSVSLDALEGYYRHLESVLLKAGYLYPHTAKPRMQKLRRLCQRANPSPEELALLRGMLRQCEWAMDHLR
jgi:tRNA/rRNA methyltransferase